MTTSPKLLPVHKRYDVTFSHGEGSYLFDNEGKKYLDFGAGIAVNALGHCHPKMVAAITSQAKKLWHVSNIYNGNELNNYAERLTSNSFADYVFFCNSGAESIECAIKMIRRYFFVKNQPHKNRIITFTGAFHGRTIATISAAGKEKYLEGFRPALDGFDNVEFGNIEAVKNAITENTAGILIEPIQGEEGIRVAEKKFLQELRKIADEKNLLLAFDEVQCGMGRTGELFAHNFFDVKPDIVGTAKAIAGGFPLGACLATKEAASGMTIGVHGTTYGGNPMAMAVASAVLDVMLEENFLENVRKVGAELKSELQNLHKKFPNLIEEIRGVGLMLGIKINEKIPNVEMTQKLINHGLLVIPASDNVIRVLPPLNINSAQVKEGIEKLEKSFLSF
ncbi:MAG: aspartate aminotransferase family protein [Proteobacteria bacterium]|nr:aspartate aminotransferase family protein [Pseudomonadota bacterium]